MKQLWILFLAFGMILPINRGAAAEEQTLYDPHGKRDPFAPLVTTTLKQSPGVLSVETLDDVGIEGVVFDPKKGSVVIINGSILKEGEEMGNLKVVQVRSDGVLLAVNDIESFKPIRSVETAPEKADT